MSNNMYISFGNNCAVAIALDELGLKGESLPFDSIISNPCIIYDCLKTDFVHFLDIKRKHKNYKMHNLLYYYPKIKATFEGFPMDSLENKYGIKFHHFIGMTEFKLTQTFLRRVHRFCDMLNTSQKLIFFHSCETYLYDDISRKNRYSDYDYLKKIDLYLSDKPCSHTIVNFTLNETLENTGNIVNIRIDVPDSYFSDNCETHQVEVFQPYRELVKKGIKEYIENN